MTCEKRSTEINEEDDQIIASRRSVDAHRQHLEGH